MNKKEDHKRNQQQRRNKYLEIPDKGQMVVLEYVRPQTTVILVGNNYDLFRMATVTEQLGWRRFVVGNHHQILPSLLSVTDGVLDLNKLEDWPLGPNTGLLQVTHDYANDLALLATLLPLDIPYYGLLGPRRRLKRLDADLQKEGHAPLSSFPQLHSPVGLDLGAETHEEIALAALAEMMAILRSGSGDHLIRGEGPIH
ncbi:MAG: XdhC family protein [Bacteroidota bacterium]